jgi:HAD superfamily hydrolase (TIGR01509 family)
MPIRAVIFDLDGTITQPYFDFDAIREEIGLGRNAGPLLEIMKGMTAQERQRAERILHRHEEAAVAASTLNPGARETLAGLRERQVSIGVLTRNQKRNAEAVAAKHGLHFDAIVGREDGPAKPDGFGARYLCEHFGVDPSETLLVGDYLFDLLCARSAGAIPVLIDSPHKREDFADHADFQIDRLSEILQIIDDRNGDHGAAQGDQDRCVSY